MYNNRYDVTLLINGLPLVQIELKRRGLEIKEAFHQILRYQRHSYWVNTGLFQYVQLFVISNGVDTKYFANNPVSTLTPKQTIFWSDKDNRKITDLTPFAAIFLHPGHLGKMLAHYVVLNEAHKVLMVLRPYQFYAVESIIERVQKTPPQNGYIWHTTGSGKTLTSFKASQIIMDLPEVHKVVFVVDRKDLDYQTMKEFNSFKQDSVDVTSDTVSLVRQFGDDTKLIVTTIQKLNNAIQTTRHSRVMDKLAHQRMVFIFDECHRSQFGETHKRITQFFHNVQLFGFTGTPIFADNAQKNEMGKRTTQDLFGECLHKYVITDAIADQNVLRFNVEYFGRYKRKGTFIDIEVEDIDVKEVIESDARAEKIVDHIIAYHNQKTHDRAYSALFAVSNIEAAIRYYGLFQAKRAAGLHDLRIATIFTFGANEEDLEAQGALPGDDFSMVADTAETYKSSHSRDQLESFIQDYNKMYGTSYSTKDPKKFADYFTNISKRLKEREKENFQDSERLDILLVVNMFLTGFDAKKVNTLYVDKNLRQHGLIQAFSRTNRILNEQKSQGNILCYRNLKKATDEAITLFSNKNPSEEILLPPYEEMVERFNKAVGALLQIAPTFKSVDALLSEEDKFAFVQAFRELLRVHNVLTSCAEFSWEDLMLSAQKFADYKSKYLDISDSIKNDRTKEKASILHDVDFELELICRDEINVSYILKLLAKLRMASPGEGSGQKKAIMDLLGGDVQLRSKRELIEKFIDDHLPKISDSDAIADEFQKYWQDQKILALNKICQDEHLDHPQFQALVDAYIFSEQDPIRQDIIACLQERPSVLQARTIGERIIAKMKEWVDVFVKGMVA